MRVFGFLKTLLFLALALYCCVFAYFVFNQRSFLYFPHPAYLNPDSVDAAQTFSEIHVKTEDSLPLTGWYAPKGSKPYTILFFHGSGDRVSNLVSFAQPFIDAGYGVILAEYRGYSGMPGKPTENGFYADARSYISWAYDNSIDIDHIIVMGHSIGAAVATQVAREFQPAGVVLLAPFTSVPDMAAKAYPYFPVRYAVLDHFFNAERVGLLTEPLFIAHGDSDTLVPLAQGQKLFDLANEPKELRVLEGVGHNDILGEATPAILEWLDVLQKKTK